MSFGTYLCCRSPVCLFRKGTACIYDWHKFKKLCKLTEPRLRTIQIHTREMKINFTNSKTHCSTIFHLAALGPILGAPSMGSFPVWHEGSLGRRRGRSGCVYSCRFLRWMCPSTKGLWSSQESLHYKTFILVKYLLFFFWFRDVKDSKLLASDSCTFSYSSCISTTLIVNLIVKKLSSIHHGWWDIGEWVITSWWNW